ncbi:6-phosphogluconate dehydrogenase, partial [Trachipleistophora hominis]
MRTTNKQAQVGLIGLAPMGRALALNLRDKGYVVAVYNRTESRTREFEKECEKEFEEVDNKGRDDVKDNKGKDNKDKDNDTKDKSINDKSTRDNDASGNDESSTRLCDDDTSTSNTNSTPTKGTFIYTYTINAFINALQQPRKILTIIKSDATDDLLAQLIPLLSKNDYILDFSNSTPDITEIRTRDTPCHYLGIGISGGTEGARNNGGLMVGGPSAAYAAVQPILFSISNSVGYFGDGGSGHFVKMVHNAVEYALMGVIAEFWEVLDRLGKHELMASWNEDMRMYLVEAAGTGV